MSGTLSATTSTTLAKDWLRVFPDEVLTLIVLFTGERNVVSILEKYTTREVWKLIKTRTLVHGQVQSGKTAFIMRVINEIHPTSNIILIVQNMSLVVSQYMQRFEECGIDYQVVVRPKQTSEKQAKKKKVEKPKITSRVVVLMNNESRLKHYMQMDGKADSYVIIMDEADMYGEHTLEKLAFHSYYVTATPYLTCYDRKFDEIIKLQPPRNYYGLGRVKFEQFNALEAVEEFMASKGGMMLVSSFTNIAVMRYHAQTWSKKHHTTPVILLSVQKLVYFDGVPTSLSGSVANIIDTYKPYSHVLFIANKMSMRGLTYASSDYSKHLTHQHTHCRSTPANNIQRIRLVGNYTDNPALTLYMPPDVTKRRITSLKKKTTTLKLELREKEFDVLPAFRNEQPDKMHYDELSTEAHFDV